MQGVPFNFKFKLRTQTPAVRREGEDSATLGRRSPPLRGQLGPAFLSREGASIVGWSGRLAAARPNRSVQNLPELIP